MVAGSALGSAKRRSRAISIGPWMSRSRVSPPGSSNTSVGCHGLETEPGTEPTKLGPTHLSASTRALVSSTAGRVTSLVNWRRRWTGAVRQPKRTSGLIIPIPASGAFRLTDPHQRAFEASLPTYERRDIAPDNGSTRCERGISPGALKVGMTVCRRAHNWCRF